MAVTYLVSGLLVILMHVNEVPAAIATIVHAAFNPVAATGGFAGATVWLAIRFGVARGIFSNEAGLGSAPIAHAAANSAGAVPNAARSDSLRKRGAIRCNWSRSASTSMPMGLSLQATAAQQPSAVLWWAMLT